MCVLTPQLSHTLGGTDTGQQDTEREASGTMSDWL